MRQVTPRRFEYGELVTDTKTGRHGQVQCISWDRMLQGWRYCISRKDVDDERNYVEESRLIKAPAQTRIDNKKTILYAPRKLKHQARAAPYSRRERGRDWGNWGAMDKFLKK